MMTQGEASRAMAIAAGFAPRCMLIVAQLLGTRKIQESLLMTSTSLGELCAGIGTAAFVVGLLRNNLIATLGLVMKLRPAYASEISSRCRSLLCDICGNVHEHLFGDMLACFPMGLSGVDMYFFELLARAMSSPFTRLLWCYRCNRMCTIPYADVLVAGIPCQDWSSIGKMNRLAGETMPILCGFIRWLLELRPKIAIVENVPGFKADIFHNVPGLNMYRAIVFPDVSPDDAGFRLLARTRLYIILVNTECCEVTDCMLTLYRTLAAHSRVGDWTEPRHAFQASAAEVATEIEALWRIRGFGKLYDTVSMLHQRELAALQWMDQLHLFKFGVPAAWSQHEVVSFLGSNPWKRLQWSGDSQRIPCYTMNNGLMWGFRANRWLTALERMATMGFPVYGPMAVAMHSTILHVPEPASTGAAIGNGMHVANLWMIMLVALSCVRDR